MPALERYDGPMWRTLRALLHRHPAAAHAYDAGRSTAELQIWVLSGRYGFIPASCELPNYEQRLTERQFAKMERDASFDFQRIPSFVEDAEAVLFAGSELPPLRDTNRLTPPRPGSVEHKAWSAVHRASGWGKLAADRARARSETFPGIALAMASQWGSLLPGHVEAEQMELFREAA
ncbi:hypothetical protein [Novosphingobium sp. ST904]|nr:hypothetical protein [Novosphingobium sp. ST904]